MTMTGLVYFAEDREEAALLLASNSHIIAKCSSALIVLMSRLPLLSQTRNFEGKKGLIRAGRVHRSHLGRLGSGADDRLAFESDLARIPL